MDADANRDRQGSAAFLLDLDGTADRIDRVGEHRQRAITVVLGDRATERFVLRSEHVLVLGSGFDAELLVLLHQGGVSDDVSEHDRRQLPALRFTW